MTDDQKSVDAVVGKFNDSSSSVDRLRTLFTKAAAPSATDAKKYADVMVTVDGEITVSGTTATDPVIITNTTTENATPVQKQWKAVKEGTAWKLSEAPLP